MANWKCGNTASRLHYIFMSYSFQLFSICFLSSCGQERRIIFNHLVIRHNEVKQHITAPSCEFVIVTKIRVESDETRLLTFCKRAWYLAEQVIRRRLAAWTNARLSKSAVSKTGQWQELTEALACYYSLVCRHDGVWVRLISSGLAQFLVLCINLPKQRYHIQYLSRPSCIYDTGRLRVHFTTVTLWYASYLDRH